MNIEKLADKEIEVFAWMQEQGYDRKASKDIAPIIVKYLQSCETRSKKIVGALKDCVEVMKVLEENGILKAVEKDNAYDNAKQALTDYEGEEEIK